MAIAVLIATMTSAMVFSSFTIVKEKNSFCKEINSNTPIYWQGKAKCGLGGKSPSSISIKVYQSAGMCNSYYAVVDDENKTECVVRENSNYNRNAPWTSDNHYQYYVSYDGSYFYFNMN